MKHFLHNSLRALFLSLAVLLSLPMLAVEVEIDGINYELVAKIKQATVIKKSSGKYSGKIVIPETVEYNGTVCYVTSIGDFAFSGCSGLTSVTIPNSVTSIGGQAFNGCKGLTSVTIPNSVTSIGNGAFWYCTGLTSVHISDIAAWCNIDFPTSSDNPLCDAHHLYLNGEEVKDLVIPNSVTSIGVGAFSGCSGLTSVTIPNSVTSIGESAFLFCSGLTSVTIGNSVTSIEREAFRDCSGLTSVTIGNSVTSIEREAFRNCPELLDVYCYAEKVPSTSSYVFVGSYPEYATLHVPAGSIESYKTTEPWSSFGTIKTLSSFSGEVEIDGINYELNGETKQATVIAKSSGSYSGNVVIPESVEHEGTTYSVTSIGEKTFYDCDDLTSVTIPNSVTSIGEDAFYGCSGLTSVHISDIAAWCNIDFDNSYSNPLRYAHHLYLNGEEVKDLVIPNSVTSIEYSAFYGCSGLTSVTIPNSVTSIGSAAFYYCSGLTSVTIPNSVTSIGESAFTHCSDLTSVHISDIAAWCNIDFAGEHSNPLSFAHHLYLNREEVKDLVIPNSVTSIRARAFEAYSGLTSVTIPNSVTSIGDHAFSNCSGLTSVTIPNSVTSIGEYAFWCCSGLTSVTIPNSVTSIGELAFYRCSGLTSVSIGNSVESIGRSAFEGCSKLIDVYCYAEKVPYTYSYAFGSSSLSYITLHVPAASIESYKTTSPWSSFGTIKALASFSGEVEIDGINYELNGETKQATVIAKSSGSYSGNVVIPESVEHEGTTYSVTSIGKSAFNSCSRLTSVTIPNSVTSIGEEAFINCLRLTSVTIGNSVTSIGERAFSSCSGLTSVTIPNSVTSIGDDAFSHCSGLTSVTIPNSVTSIGYSAFEGCSGLTSIVVEDGNPVYDSRNNCNAIIETATNTLHSGCKTTIIPNSVTSIGGYAFSFCTGLTSVTIPNSVTSIGDHAFRYCSGLTSVTIPNSVTSIGNYAFSHCSGLTSVTIGNGVTSIGDDAFWNCSGLTSVTIGNSVKSIGGQAFRDCPELLDVYCYAEDVPYTYSDAFEGSYPENATLHVPAASLDSYKATAPWGGFGKIVAISESTNDLVIKDGESFENTEERELGTLTYTRTLPNRYWNPLYVPFKIPYEKLADNYDVAYINSMHSYDNDQDGEIEKMTMEVIKIKKGVLKANHPYLIRAKNEAARQMDLLLEDVTLYPTVSNKLDCSSVYTHFEITGTYKKMTREDLGGSLVITTDGAWKKLAASSELKPFRFYLTITDREGSPLEVSEDAKSRINICVQGEDDFATGIDEVKSENSNVKTAVYDLSGRRVQKAQKGIFIQNGKLMVK